MPKTKIKTLLLGLENSGKTSIVLSLKKNINLLDHMSRLEPTKSFEVNKIEEGDLVYHVWDFGGQKQYREDHLHNFSTYLTGTNKIIYIIDVQDDNRYDLSLQFFDGILEILKQEKMLIKLSVFLHKYDPHLEFDEKAISELVDKINEKIPPNWDYEIFKTSVYTVFRKISTI